MPAKERGLMIKKYFEMKILRNTCFNSLDELLKDETSCQINAPRALLACELKGVWRGLNLATELYWKLKDEGKE